MTSFWVCNKHNTFVSIPHPGPQLVCQPDLPEHLRDGRVLGVRLKGGQMQSTVSVGTIGVFCVEPIALDHKFCYIAARVIPVGQAVGADLAQDAVSGADALDAFLHKGVTEVFWPKAISLRSSASVIGATAPLRCWICTSLLYGIFKLYQTHSDRDMILKKVSANMENARHCLAN